MMIIVPAKAYGASGDGVRQLMAMTEEVAIDNETHGNTSKYKEIF
ncbi:hypothetical protein [Limoniibacter endophyticus]|nr:hypothetical protein [Limoniibacter endophyticus]